VLVAIAVLLCALRAPQAPNSPVAARTEPATKQGAAAPRRAALPSEEALGEARAQLAEALAALEAAADAASDPRAKVRRLLELAEAQGANAARRLVLLDRALDAALAAREFESATAALLALDQHFEAVLLTRLQRALKAARKDSAGTTQIAQWGLARVGDLFEAGQLELGSDVHHELRRAAGKLEELRPALEECKRRYVEDFDRIRPHLEQLRSAPEHPASNHAVGYYHCFVRGDFDRGLPHLRRSDFSELRALAALDDGPRAEPAACEDLAQRWERLANSTTLRSARAKACALRRTAHWLERAQQLSQSAGRKARVEQLLRQIDELELQATTTVAARPASSDKPTRGPAGANASPHSAVLADALSWLAQHQAPDGRWSPEDFSSHCGQVGEGRCDGAGEPLNVVGVSALALLALLESGSAPGAGAYGDNVARGVDWLAGQQLLPLGVFGGKLGHAFLYNHALACIALASAYRAAPSDELRSVLELGVQFSLSARNEHGAWRYSHPPSGENDTSVTGWMVESLVRAKECGIAVDPQAFVGALTWIEEATDPSNGRVGYDAVGTPSSRVTRVNEHFNEQRGETMTAVGLWCRYLLGQTRADTPVIEKHAKLIELARPVWSATPEHKNGVDVLFWRYGANAFHALGSADGSAWRAELAVELAHAQRRDGHFRGSWDPTADPWGYAGGRVATTAIAASCLLVGSRPAPRPLAPRIVSAPRKQEDDPWKPPARKPERFPLPGEKD